MMRRKLKNRVAAQYARDRKKVLVDEMAITISDLQQEKLQLTHENDVLKRTNQQLVQEVASLKRALSLAGGVEVEEVKEKTFESAAFISDRQPRDQVFSEAEPVSHPCQPDSSSSSNKNNNFFSCLMLMMASLTIASSRLATRSSPPSMTVSRDSFTKCSLKSLNALQDLTQQEESDRRDPHWWGSQQQSWNPAKIRLPLIQ